MLAYIYIFQKVSTQWNHVQNRPKNYFPRKQRISQRRHVSHCKSLFSFVRLSLPFSLAQARGSICRLSPFPICTPRVQRSSAKTNGLFNFALCVRNANFWRKSRYLRCALSRLSSRALVNSKNSFSLYEVSPAEVSKGGIFREILEFSCTSWL